MYRLLYLGVIALALFGFHIMTTGASGNKGVFQYNSGVIMILISLVGILWIVLFPPQTNKKP